MFLAQGFDFVAFAVSSARARARARARLAKASRDPKSLAVVRRRIAARDGREKLVTDHRAENGPRASLKRPSSSALPDTSSDSKRVNSMVDVEAAEVRGECSLGLAQSSMKMWKSVVASSDVEFFRHGVSDAQRVSFPCLVCDETVFC